MRMTTNCKGEVQAFVDFERSPGQWIRAHALLAPADPDVGIFRPQVVSIFGFDRERHEVVELTSEEVASLGGHFEEWFERETRRQACVTSRF